MAPDSSSWKKYGHAGTAWQTFSPCESRSFGSYAVKLWFEAADSLREEDDFNDLLLVLSEVSSQDDTCFGQVYHSLNTLNTFSRSFQLDLSSKFQLNVFYVKKIALELRTLLWNDAEQAQKSCLSLL